MPTTDTLGIHGPPQMLMLDGGRRWRLLAPFAVRYAGLRYTAPAGFETDLASVPRLFWRIYPTTGPYAEAAIIHDWNWSTWGPNHAGNLLFLALMERAGCNWITRHLFYLAVEIGMRWRNRGGR